MLFGGGVCKASANKISSVAASIIDRCSCFMYPVRTRLVSLTSPLMERREPWHEARLVSAAALTHAGTDVQKALNSHTSPFLPPPRTTQTVAHQKKTAHHPTVSSVSGGITLRFSCCCVAKPSRHRLRCGRDIHQLLCLRLSDGASLSSRDEISAVLLGRQRRGSAAA